MYIFIISIILVSFIGLCFYKKSFWENRFILLLIITGVGIVATVTSNYVVRGEYALVPETLNEREIWQYGVPDSLMVDGIPFQKSDDYSFTSDFNFRVDSLQPPNTSIFFYNMHLKKPYWKIGFIKSNGKKKSVYWEDVYILQSPVDTVAYFNTMKIVHDFSTAPKWVSKYSVPRRKTITCFYVPPTQYAAIPDSLIREFPVKLN